MKSWYNSENNLKKSLSHEINYSLPRRESFNKMMHNYNQIIKTDYYPNRTRTPYHEENRHNPLKIKIPSFGQKQQIMKSRYTSNTHNPLLIINSRRNKEENSINENNSLYANTTRRKLNSQYNFSDDNIFKRKNEETKYQSNDIQRNNRRNNQLSLDLNSKNNNNNNKYLINEELSRNKANNIQIKTTRVVKIKNTQNENNIKQTEHNRRINYKIIENQKNNSNEVFYSTYSNNKKDIKKNERQNSYDNYKLYNSNNQRRYKNENIINTNVTNLAKPKENNNNINNNITKMNPQNNHRRNHFITVIKETNKNKEKENKKETDISNPKNHIRQQNIKNITSINNNSSKTINDDKEEEEQSDDDNDKQSSLMFSEDNDFGEMKTPIKLSPEIFNLYHPKFKPGIYSSENEFNNSNELIKAYAYNTSEGNIREYNEDTITVTKINLNTKEKNDYCYFFAVYDGHGGNGCSLYLKNNLHKNITEFSVKGLKSAIEITEDNFLTKKAIDNDYNLVDTSGSCGIILLIKNKKCIIANIGDSRLVIFKNKRVIFSTKDHKPNTYMEKRRIEKAGGSVYQTTAAIPIYQNGKLIEIPWRVCPGGLSVSRTFGDIETKNESLGGKKGVVVALPDISEFDLNEQYNFIVIGCDGIFDVLSNGEIIDCIKFVLKLNKEKNKKINELCGDFANMIIKSALAKESFDNVSCIVIVFNINDFI
jgi:serine/threonine protein phosphatase PrpC